MPSGSAQEALIRSVYRKAQLDLQDTVYFEAHGTGTAVGEVVEVNAIARVFRPQSTPDQSEVKAVLPFGFGLSEGKYRAKRSAYRTCGSHLDDPSVAK